MYNKRTLIHDSLHEEIMEYARVYYPQQTVDPHSVDRVLSHRDRQLTNEALVTEHEGDEAIQEFG